MSLYDLNFQPLLITELFIPHNGSGRAKTEEGAYPYVAASFQNNGIVGYVPEPKYPGNWLSLVKDGDGGAGTSFYQPVPFWPSNHVYALEPRVRGLSPEALIILAALITDQCFPKYNRGYALNKARLSRQHIMVPMKPGRYGVEDIDWEGIQGLGEKMFSAVRQQASDSITTNGILDQELPVLDFDPLLITDVFETMSASQAWYDKISITKGDPKHLFLSQTQSNNSVSDYIAYQGKHPELGNCITITLKTQSTFYQPVSFYTAQNFLIFRHTQLNEDNGLFLTTALRKAVEKFSWGYGVSMARLEKTKVMVPVLRYMNGTIDIDWEGMSLYGRILRIKAEKHALKALENI